MMYLSTLLIDVGSNPDRPRPGRLWLRNLYRVHQRLCMAFPSVSRKGADRDFLAPYCPEDFPEQRHLADRSAKEVEKETLKNVHARRDVGRGFLFRIDPQPGGRVVIFVQSAKKPDWDYAFHNAGYLLAAPPECKEIDPCFTKGQRLLFRLVANPTRRLSRNSFGADGRPIEKKWIGKRVPVPTDHLYNWLTHRAEQSGFSVDKDSTLVQPGYSYFKKLKKGPENTRTEEREDNGRNDEARPCTVRFEGILQVNVPERFQEILIRGIGPGKAFGFGLLSVAPCRPSS